MNILYYGLIGMCVSFFIGIMLKARIQISVLGAVLGGASCSIFVICGSNKFGFFAGTLLLALLSELLAKKVQTPSTLFLIIGIYPLVPGAGIYQTIMQVIESKYDKALITGGDTFINIVLMATAIALVSIMFGKTSEERFKKHRDILN